MNRAWYITASVFFLVLLATSCSSNGSSSEENVENAEGAKHGTSKPGSEVTEPDEKKPSILDTLTVEDADDLPPCNEELNGRFFFIDGESLPYFCVKGEWLNASDSTSFSITCADGSLQAVDKIDHEIVTNPPDYIDPNTPNNGNPWDQNQNNQNPPVPSGFDAPIAGTAQKGPFIPGANITVQEIDSFFGHEMQQVAEGCVIGNAGQFRIDNVHSDSNCVKIKVTGHYLDELTGGSSDSPITLAARTCTPSKANVNILTHLEIPRIEQLTMSHIDYSIAKPQAEREILAAFGIDIAGDMPSAVEMDILDNSEYSAALIAISAMLKGGRDETEMMALANNLAEDIKGDGVWNDPNWKIKIADWVVGFDSAGKYANIRNNLTAWGAKTIPDFEKYMRGFFPIAYGFEPCNSSNAGAVTFVNQGQSVYFANDYEHADHSKVRFICDAKTQQWRVANALEKDTVGFGPGEYDKEIREGLVNHDINYIYDNGKWRVATAEEADGFTEISKVYASLKPNDKAVFIIRHSERTSNTGKSGHLTENGVKYAQELGARLAAVAKEDFYYGYSGYTRTMETCENIAKGKGQSNYQLEVIDELDGGWYVKDSKKVESYSSSDGGGWAVYSKYAFTGAYLDAFYDLKSKSNQLLDNVILANMGNMKRVNFMCTHDYLLVPLLAYVTDGHANVRYYEKRRWLNYLSGVAMIISEDGSIRYIPVRGLGSGTMQ